MDLPPELGGKGNGANPEQMLSLGYSCCFLGSLKAVAAKAGKAELVKDAVVHAKVHMGKPDGYALGVELEVTGAPQDLVDAAHNVGSALPVDLQ
ncbi:hypothetical protein ONZ45_g19512 [Pleurotus djamor]|nr:hypothetical protein ONZ45_g19512 [Pleurotus djamor]